MMDYAYYAQHGAWRHDYDRLARHLLDVLGETPETSYDIGCGAGYLVDALAAAGVAKASGCDSNVNAIAYAKQQLGLDVRPIDVVLDAPDVLYPLVTCVEVLEHIQHSEANAAVDYICGSASKWLYLSAALPGQQGDGHVNCQPPMYWIERLGRRGFVLDVARSKTLQSYLRDTLLDMRWLIRNPMIFKYGASI
jgi:SAM-dependent methyltransferase